MRRREDVVDEAPAERERKEDRREERRVHRRAAQDAEERDDGPRHPHERQRHDDAPRELDGQEAREPRDEDVKEPVVREVVELVGALLGRRGVRQAARDVAQREVLRVVDARQQLRDEEARDDEPDGGPVEERRPPRVEHEVIDEAPGQRPLDRGLPRPGVAARAPTWSPPAGRIAGGWPRSREPFTARGRQWPSGVRAGKLADAGLGMGA